MGVQGVTEEDAKKVEQMVFETLQKVVNEGKKNLKYFYLLFFIYFLFIFNLFLI